MTARMPPPLFSQRALTEPLDPRFTFVPMWYLMHAPACRAGLFRARRVRALAVAAVPAWAHQSDLFMGEA